MLRPRCPSCNTMQTPLSTVALLVNSAICRTTSCRKCGAALSGDRPRSSWVLLTAPVSLVELIAYLLNDGLLRSHADIWIGLGVASMSIAAIAYVAFISKVRVES